MDEHLAIALLLMTEKTKGAVLLFKTRLKMSESFSLIPWCRLCVSLAAVSGGPALCPGRLPKLHVDRWVSSLMTAL